MGKGFRAAIQFGFNQGVAVLCIVLFLVLPTTGGFRKTCGNSKKFLIVLFPFHALFYFHQSIKIF
jgi:hypothetical protein